MAYALDVDYRLKPADGRLDPDDYDFRLTVDVLPRAGDEIELDTGERLSVYQVVRLVHRAQRRTEPDGEWVTRKIKVIANKLEPRSKSLGLPTLGHG